MAKAFIFVVFRLTDQDWYWEGWMRSFLYESCPLRSGKSCALKGKSRPQKGKSSPRGGRWSWWEGILVDAQNTVLVRSQRWFFYKSLKSRVKWAKKLLRNKRAKTDAMTTHSDGFLAGVEFDILGPTSRACCRGLPRSTSTISIITISNWDFRLPWLT